MIIECAEKEITRKLYEEAFDDPEEFVDYYYADKCRDNRMIVSMEDGEAVSMLHLNPYSISLCGTAVKSYYIVAVATMADRRNEGQMTRVFEYTMRLLKDEKVPFVFLLPVDESIYSWMGFEKICDFSMEKISDYDEIKSTYDVFCIRDENYIRRMNIENRFREHGTGEGMPKDPVIMARIVDLDAFSSAAGRVFSNEKEALEWLRSKKIYISEEV